MMFSASLSFSQDYSEDWSQKLQPEAYFQEKDIRIGEIVHYSISLKYPRELSVLFPDSTYNYEPFEYVGKEYFNTETVAGFSRDSVVYKLRTFEILDSLSLTLPVYLLEDQDSVALYPQTSTIWFKTSVDEKSESKISAEIPLMEVPTRFNSPFFFKVIGVCVVLLLVILVVFGKRMFARIRIYRLEKKHKKFLLAFSLYHAKSELGEKEAEAMIILWKSYLEKLTKLPLQKYTTKEVKSIFKDEALVKSLQNIDQVVYAGALVESLITDIETLEAFAQKIFEEKQNEIKNK